MILHFILSEQMSVIYIVEVDVLLEWLWVLISVFDFVSRLKFIKIHFLYWVTERQKALYMFYKCSVDNRLLQRYDEHIAVLRDDQSPYFLTSFCSNH